MCRAGGEGEVNCGNWFGLSGSLERVIMAVAFATDGGMLFGFLRKFRRLLVLTNYRWM